MRLSLPRAIWLVLAAAIIPACASSHHGFIPRSLPPLARLAYVANNDGTISGYFVDTQSGQLSTAGFAAAYTGAAPVVAHQIALAPGGQLAWALKTGAGPAISSFVVNTVNGALTSSSVAAPLASIVSASTFAIDPALRYGYVVDGSAAGFVQAYTLSGTGVFTALGTPVSTGAGTTNPVAIAVPPSGSFVYVANQTSGTVAGFLGGSLAPLTLSPYIAGVTPVDIRTDPQGFYVFVLCQGAPASVWVYSITSTGDLSTVAGSPFQLPPALSAPTYLAVDPLSRFVWAGNAAGKVSALSLNAATGALAAGPTISFNIPVAGTPLSMTVDPSGQLAFVSMAGGSILSLAVGSDGTLTGPPPPAPATIALSSVRTRGSNPSAVAIVQSTAPVLRTPTYSYVASGSGISGFGITAGTGVLSPLVGSPFVAGTAFGSVTVDPYGSFAYATEVGGALLPIGQFAISGGTLVPIAAPPSIASATQILADPSGQYVFVASSGTVTSFPKDPVTGALIGAGSPVGVLGVTFLAIDPLGSFLLEGGTSGLFAQKIDAATGLLGASTTVVGSSVVTAAASPTGQGVYVGSGTSITFASVTSPAVVVTSGGTTTLPVGNSVVSLAMDFTGTLLYAASNLGQIFTYSVNPTSPSVLTLQASASTSPGAAIPLGTDPSGSFLFASSSGNGSLWSYSPGGFGGSQLLTVPGTPILVGTSPSAAAVAPLLQ
jgi:6-phosphogluconolactonase